MSENMDQLERDTLLAERLKKLLEGPNGYMVSSAYHHAFRMLQNDKDDPR